MKQINQENSWMEKYAPLGINIALEVLVYVSSMTVSILWSFTFLIKYFDERSMLFETVRGKKVVIKGAMMPAFSSLSDGCFDVFGLVIILLIGLIGYHYLYHYQGSKAIYLMRRLPNRWELHKRCTILPLGAMLSAVVVMLVIRLLYFGIYLIFTPQQCLPL